MKELLFLLAWLAGWVVTARVLFVRWRRDDPEADTFIPTVAGLIWPVLLGVVVALSPLLAVGWLVSLRPPGSRS